MEGLPTNLPKDPDALIALLKKQQREIDSLHHTLTRKDQTLANRDETLAHRDKTLVEKDDTIRQLEERLRVLLIQRFGKSSEKFNPDQFHLFNEAELLAELNPMEKPDPIEIKAHRRQTHKSSHALPAHLPRVEVVHDLDEPLKQCDCGKLLVEIDEEILEQLSVVPKQYYVIRHRRKKYACSCKQCIRTASMPAQPLPSSQASPQVIADAMVSKYRDGIPLYRQEKIAGRGDVPLPRGKLARWIIDGSGVFQVMLNLLIDTFFSYDIAQSDDTGIQVLKEVGRTPHNQSALWIRRGGPPDKPVVLVDYAASKSGQTAYGLLSEFRGTLVCDGASNFNLAVSRNQLKVALCNDHARRRFKRVFDQLSKEDKKGAAGSVAAEGVRRYKALYRIEKEIKSLSVEQKVAARQKEALPVWKSFIDWAKQTQAEGVRHPGTRDALSYLLKHAKELQTYCHDGRLPISNIRSEHVAKTIAIARKNFMFSDTPAGAQASGRVFSMIETAIVNGHHPQRYLAVLLSELPNSSSVEEIEALLPWHIDPDEVNRRYREYPAP